LAEEFLGKEPLLRGRGLGRIRFRLFSEKQLLEMAVVFDNRVLRRIFGHKMEEETWGWRNYIMRNFIKFMD
jgi:hypothetical protein